MTDERLPRRRVQGPGGQMDFPINSPRSLGKKKLALGGSGKDSWGGSLLTDGNESESGYDTADLMRMPTLDGAGRQRSGRRHNRNDPYSSSRKEKDDEDNNRSGKNKHNDRGVDELFDSSFNDSDFVGTFVDDSESDANPREKNGRQSHNNRRGSQSHSPKPNGRRDNSPRRSRHKSAEKEKSRDRRDKDRDRDKDREKDRDRDRKDKDKRKSKRKESKQEDHSRSSNKGNDKGTDNFDFSDDMSWAEEQLEQIDGTVEVPVVQANVSKIDLNDSAWFVGDGGFGPEGDDGLFPDDPLRDSTHDNADLESLASNHGKNRRGKNKKYHRRKDSGDDSHNNRGSLAQTLEGRKSRYRDDDDDDSIMNNSISSLNNSMHKDVRRGRRGVAGPNLLNISKDHSRRNRRVSTYDSESDASQSNRIRSSRRNRPSTLGKSSLDTGLMDSKSSLFDDEYIDDAMAPDPRRNANGVRRANSAVDPSELDVDEIHEKSNNNSGRLEGGGRAPRRGSYLPSALEGSSSCRSPGGGGGGGSSAAPKESVRGPGAAGMRREGSLRALQGRQGGPIGRRRNRMSRRNNLDASVSDIDVGAADTDGEESDFGSTSDINDSLNEKSQRRRSKALKGVTSLFTGVDNSFHSSARNMHVSDSNMHRRRNQVRDEDDDDNNPADYINKLGYQNPDTSNRRRRNKKEKEAEKKEGEEGYGSDWSFTVDNILNKNRQHRRSTDDIVPRRGSTGDSEAMRRAYLARKKQGLK